MLNTREKQQLKDLLTKLGVDAPGTPASGDNTPNQVRNNKAARKSQRKYKAFSKELVADMAETLGDRFPHYVTYVAIVFHLMNAWPS